MKRYRTWAYLNAEGKQAWGDIFPNGAVPVQSMLPQTATLEGIEAAERVFIVAWKDLTPQQQDAILEKLSKQHKASKDAILKDITKKGLPLREKYTDGSGTTRLGFFV
ncbi:MAG: hypothetical protein NWE99_01130 [Candidatus Bathyarchaeota archaeon]|nr:hypothetical protein [Candidatus Bathyarchaeota archaeon]